MVSFIDVPEFPATGANNFSVTLYPDGTFDMAFGAMDATSGLTGSTEGGGAADPGETDLSAGGPFPYSGTTYELFTGDFDLELSLLMFSSP